MGGGAAFVGTQQPAVRKTFGCELPQKVLQKLLAGLPLGSTWQTMTISPGETLTAIRASQAPSSLYPSPLVRGWCITTA